MNIKYTFIKKCLIEFRSESFVMIAYNCSYACYLYITILPLHLPPTAVAYL